MDRIMIPPGIQLFWKKYRYVLLVLAVGLVLMALPGRTNNKQSAPAPEPTAAAESMEERLEKILTQIDGVGRAKVLLTEASGAETVYQTDGESYENSDRRRTQTVIISNGSREASGLIRSVNPPAYLGAVVVCQGGNLPAVKLAVVEAVANATGLSADRITVLKMK